MERFGLDGFPNPKAMTVWEYMAALTADQWTEHIGYLYRTDPTIARVSGAPGYLLKFTGPLAESDVAEQYGGRAFVLHLKRGDRALYQHRFAIEAPPKFQSGETPARPGAAPAAGDDLTRLLVEDAIQQRDRAQNPAVTGTALQNALDIQSAGFKSALDAVKQAQGTQIKEHTSLEAALLTKLLDRALTPPAPPEDPVERIERAIALVERLKPAPPAPAATSLLVDEDGAPANPLTAFVSGLAARLPEILDRGVKMMELYVEGQRVARSGPVIAIPPPAPIPAAVPQPPAAPVAVSVTRAQVCKEAILAALAAGDDGDDAALIAERIDAEYAERLAATLKSNPAALSDDPLFVAAFQDPRAAAFAQQFVDYFADSDGH